jgi:hypothetical protein
MVVSPLLSSLYVVPEEYCRQTNGTPRFLCDESVSGNASFRVLNTWDENPARQQTAASVTSNCRSMFIMNNGDRIYICNGWLEKKKVNNLYIIRALLLSTINP